MDQKEYDNRYGTHYVAEKAIEDQIQELIQSKITSCDVLTDEYEILANLLEEIKNLVNKAKVSK